VQKETRNTKKTTTKKHNKQNKSNSAWKGVGRRKLI